MSFENDIEKDDKGFAEVSFRVKGDALGSLLRFLKHLEFCGNIGHSFEIVSDPDNSEYRQTCGFDGDGSDRVEDIKVNGTSLPTDFKWKKASRWSQIAHRLATEV